MCPVNYPESDSPSDSDGLSRVKVLVLTVSGIFTGYTTYRRHQRLLDALNKGFFTPKIQSTSDFMPLYDLDIHEPGNMVRHMDMVYLRKGSILFVGEQTNEPRPPSTLVYPMRKKKPIQAIINLPETSLKGNMHSEMWEELQDAINRNDQFIPLTDVDFSTPLLEGISHLSFVAVNKERIVYVGKVDAIHPVAAE